MKIVLFSKPTNSDLKNYKGLYMQSDFFEFAKTKNSSLKKLLEWFYNYPSEDEFFAYTNENETKLISLYKMLKEESWEGDLILFSDSLDFPKVKNYTLIGYDICGDSMYFSPLGENFLDSYDNSAFFKDMSKSEFNKYKKDLNSFGLFNTYDIAHKFSEYCIEINKKDSIIETENNWRPFAIYIFKEE